MKRSELAFVLARIPLDAIALIIAFSLAYFTRLQSGVVYVWDFQTFIRFILAFVPFWLALFALEGLYRIKASKRLVEEFGKVFLGVSSALMLLVLWIFLSRTEFFSRLVVVYGFVYSILFVFALRFILRLIQRHFFKFGVGVHRVAVIGDNGVSNQLIGQIQKDRGLGFKLMKMYRRDDIDTLMRSPILKEIDEIILADPATSESKVLELIEFCEQRRIGFRMVPNLFRVHALNVELSHIYGIPVIEFKKSPLGGWWRIIKRISDIVLALLALLISSPIMLITAIALKLDSPGPIFYRNQRVGPNGVFSTLKFRSMYIEYCTGEQYGGAQAIKYEKQLIKKANTRSGGIYKIKDDPRVTRAGQFIRKTSIDELPQLFNVLLGNMSIVGPRPHQPREVKHYHSDYQKLLHVKPGITGLAQTSGRSDLDTDDEVKLDTFYVENWSLWLDLQIILRTPVAILHKREVM